MLNAQVVGLEGARFAVSCAYDSQPPRNIIKSTYHNAARSVQLRFALKPAQLHVRAARWKRIGWRWQRGITEDGDMLIVGQGHLKHDARDVQLCIAAGITISIHAEPSTAPRSPTDLATLRAERKHHPAA